MPIANYDCEGTLTISSISMNRPAWAVQSDERGTNGLLQVLTLTERRGEDRRVPGTLGLIPYRRRLDAVRMDFRILVAGDVDVNGVSNADHTEGLIANLAYLRTNILASPATDAGTRPATVTLPGQSALSADIHVLGLQVQEYHLGVNAVWGGTLQISVPGGEFA